MSKNKDQYEFTPRTQAKIITAIIAYRAGLARSSEIKNNKSIWTKNLKHSGTLFLNALKTKMMMMFGDYSVWKEYKPIESKVIKILADAEDELTEIFEKLERERASENIKEEN